MKNRGGRKERGGNRRREEVMKKEKGIFRPKIISNLFFLSERIFGVKMSSQNC